MKKPCLLFLSAICMAHGQLLYVNSAVYKFIVGLSVPIDVEAPGRSLGWLVNLQGLYKLPDNITYFQPYKVIQKRGISSVVNRDLLYKSIEPFFERLGLPGKGCLLQLICEAAGVDLRGKEEPLLGNLLNILFTPSYEEVVGGDYLEAYSRGSQQDPQCSNLFNCTSPSTSILEKWSYELPKS